MSDSAGGDDHKPAFVDLGEDDPEEMDLDDIQDEYTDLADALFNHGGFGEDWEDEAYKRSMALWSELRERTDVEEPECPECGERRWGQVPGDPVECRACGYEALEEMEERVHDAWDAMFEEDEQDE